MSALATLLKLQPATTELLRKCLLVLLDKDDVQVEDMSIERFSNILKWFGPLKRDDSAPHIGATNLAERIIWTMSKPWCFGPINSQQAATFLKLHVKEPGSLSLFLWAFPCRIFYLQTIMSLSRHILGPLQPRRQ